MTGPTGTGPIESDDHVIQSLVEAEALIACAENFALMLEELGQIELPPAATADPMQLRGVASLYLASALDGAGLIDAADDFARMVRTGLLNGDLGEAMPLVQQFWQDRRTRVQQNERRALFARLFGTPSESVDVERGSNGDFDALMLDLCEAVLNSAKTGSTRQTYNAAMRLAENIASVANDAQLMMAREIIACLSQAIGILNHANVRAMLSSRTMWDVVAAIDRRMKRPVRATLNHLRRGRAGMAVLAWLADGIGNAERDGPNAFAPSELVTGSAVDWVNETVSLLQQEGSDAPQASPAAKGKSSGPGWTDLAS